MYIIAGSTGTLGTAIVDALSKENELFLIGRDETKLKEQASAINACLLYTSPSPRDMRRSRMPSSA